jgi:hypothetical protein
MMFNQGKAQRTRRNISMRLVTPSAGEVRRFLQLVLLRVCNSHTKQIQIEPYA